jgi:mxaA protein
MEKLQRFALAATVCSALWTGSSAVAAAAPLPRGVLAMSLEAPRDFGYVIGDVIHYTVVIDSERGVGIDPASLPTEGWIHRWLWLRRVSLRVREEDRVLRHRLTLEYQTFYAPREVKDLTLPALPLALSGSAEVLEIPAWRFTMAPIRELSVARADGLEPMRPDALPALLETGQYRRLLLTAVVTAAAAATAWTYYAAWLPYGRRGRHFVAACRTLRLLQGRSADPAAVRAGFTCLHRAFDRTWGEPLFRERLPDFFRARPAYLPLRSEIEAFFQDSYEVFFGEEDSRSSAFDLPRLDRLAHACLRAERSGG